MKVKILKDVYSIAGWRREGDVVSLEGKELNHYINRGFAIEFKEEKPKRETKEQKTPRRRTTKKS